MGIIGNTEQEKCGLHIIISDNLVNERGWNASNWIKEVSAHIQGGGGGQPFYASAGGKKCSRHSTSNKRFRKENLAFKVLRNMPYSIS